MVEPVYFPDAPDPGFLPFEKPPETGLLQGLGLSIEDAWAKGVDHTLFLGAEKALLDRVNPGQFLSSEEYENSEFKVPGKSFPFGVSESVARLTRDQFQSNLLRETKLQNMAPGFLSGSTKFVGELLGSLTTPVQAGLTFLGPELIGVKSATTIAKLSQASTPVYHLGRLGLGAAEGIVATAPMALSDFDYNLQINDNPHVLNLLTNLGIGAAFGGAIRGIFGWHESLEKESDQVAKETALKQLIAGKSVHVDDIVKNGWYQSVMKGRPIVPIDIQNKASEELQTIIDGIQKNIDDIGEVPENEHGATLLNRTLEILKKSPLDRTEEEEMFLDRIPRTDFFEDLFDAATEDPLARTDEQKSILENLLNDNERPALELEFKRLSEALKEDPTDILSERKLLDVANRIDDLAALRKKLSPEQLQKILELERQKLRLRDLKEIQEGNSIISDLQDGAEPVTREELETSIDQINSPKGDSSWIEDKDIDLDTEIDPDLKEQTEALKTRANALRDAGKLSDEAIEDLDQIEKDKKNLSIFNNALDNMVRCLVGRGGNV